MSITVTISVIAISHFTYHTYNHNDHCYILFQHTEQTTSITVATTKGQNEMFYLMMYWTHFIYGYMVLDIF